MDMRKRIGSITLPCWTPGLNQDKTSPWVPSLESLQSSVEWSTLSDALLGIFSLDCVLQIVYLIHLCIDEKIG